MTCRTKELDIFLSTQPTKASASQEELDNSQQELRVKLDHSIKHVESITLMGYSIRDRKTVSPSQSIYTTNLSLDSKGTADPVTGVIPLIPAEPPFYALHVAHVGGAVLSNNEHANGAFAILHVPAYVPGLTASSGITDTIGPSLSHHVYEPRGIATHIFECGTCRLHEIELKVTDHKGVSVLNDNTQGQMHFWLKIKVQHG